MGKCEYVIFSFVKWDGLRNRSHHIAGSLMRTARTLWINPPVSFRSRPVLTFDTVRVSDNLTVADLPGGIPGRNYGIPNYLSQRYWGRALRRRLRVWRTPGVPLTAIMHIPYVETIAFTTGFDVTVYDSHDDWRYIPGNRAAVVDAAERRIARRADVILAASKKCAERFRRLGRATVSLPNGCDPEHWAQVASLDAHATIAGLAGPRFVYAGGIDGCIDLDAVRGLAEKFRGCSIVLAGNVNDRRVADELVRVPGVRLIGPLDYAELPTLFAGADALILPFRLTPWSRARDCIKLYEYLATGLPVIATALDRAVHLSGVAVADPAGGGAGFAAAVAAALANDSADLSALRKSVARANSWEARGRRLAEVVADTLNGRRDGA